MAQFIRVGRRCRHGHGEVAAPAVEFGLQIAVLVSALRHCHRPSETKEGISTASSSAPISADCLRPTLAGAAAGRAYWAA